MPPGVVGGARLQRRGAVQNYYQPVRFSGPDGVRFALADGGVFQPNSEPQLHAGLLIGAVYRFKITGIPNEPGLELFPTVEIIDRTYPPPGQANRFPIPINIDRFDLQDASEGRMVTRVVYLEDPTTALPLPETLDTARSFDVSQQQDPLEVADQLGRPVAIIRIGSLTPPNEPSLLPRFFFGGPPWLLMTPARSAAVATPGEGAVTRTPHIPRTDDGTLEPQPMYRPSFGPQAPGPPQIASPYGPGYSTPTYQR